jgi:radical SAM superfamily enzyme YgiQ (UPF0313 family)
VKVVLIQPPIQDFYETDIRLQPIGLAYIKAAVKKHLPHVDVVIHDFHQGWSRRTVAVPSELKYLKPYYAHPDKSPFSSFHHYYHFGADFEAIAEQIARDKPDLVGISSLFSPYAREVIKTAQAIKARMDVPIVLGGSHVSAMPEEMLSHPEVDYIIRGEGEKPLVELIRQLEGECRLDLVPNLGYKMDGVLKMNPTEDNFEIEELPMGDLEDLKLENYLFEKKPLCFVITSRSCPHKCSFCSVHMTFGNSYRRRSVAHVIHELKKRYEDGYRVFDFEDDNLTYYRKEMKDLCRELIEAFPNRDVQFLAMNGISYLSLDDELMILMKEAGFTHLNLALVSSDITVRETTKRPHTIEKYLQVVSKAFELGFQTTSYQILGLPNESLESMVQTLVFASREPVLLGASMFYLTPNSPIAKDMNFISSEKDVFKSRLTAMAIETDHFKREDIYTLFVTTRILNFIKSLESTTEREDSFESSLKRAYENNGRDRLGAEILRKLFQEKVLYAFTLNGFQKLEKFKYDLFEKIWTQLGFIRTRSGGKIDIPKNLELVKN